MQDILFKVKDNKFYINVPDELTNKQFLEGLKAKIEKLLILKNTLKENVILNIDKRKLDNREILQLFDILNDANIFYLSRVNCQSKNKESLSIYKGCFRSGQIRFFEKSLLLIGNINKGSKVIVNGDLYVLGKINGDVEIKDKKGRIYCEFIKNSLIKIANKYKLYTEELENKEIYYMDGEVVETDYIKGEKHYGKSDSSYIR